MKIISASDPIVGWHIWSVFSPTLRNPHWFLKGDFGSHSCGSDPWQPRTVTVSEWKDRLPHLSPDQRGFVDAYWEKSYLIPLPFTLDMARIESPSVVGEVIGWGKVVEQDDGWWASYYYPLRIAVVCNKCLIYERVLQPVKYVHAWQYWEGNPYYTGYCSTHMLERAYSDTPFSPESHWLPAREIEARLMARYGVGRADLPVVEDDPGLFLAEMGIKEEKG